MSDNLIDTEILTPLVSRVFKIEDVTRGGSKDNYLVRYRGKLIIDSVSAYDALAKSLKYYRITPLFRNEKDQQIILLINGVIEPKPSNPWVNLILFMITFLSVIFAGALYAYDGPEPNSISDLLASILFSLPKGIPFAISLLTILLAHEFGHYLAGRYHKTHVTLPYFLPLPFSPFGTLGAFIQLKEPPKNKRVLLDIGLAGPIAGLIVAIPVLFIGLSLSQLTPIESTPGLILEGNSILYLASKYLMFGKLLPEPIHYEITPFLYWIRYFFTSQPIPIGGMDVLIHPVAWAGWAGLLVTALNLIPAGQLDGGHVIFTLFGHRAKSFFPVILVALVGLGFFWNGWWLWAVLLFFLGRVYAEPLDQITELDERRRAFAILGVVIFILTFTPVPLYQALAVGIP
jgi:membrane-associated protease RseP (regulator of RpoE activity)